MPSSRKPTCDTVEYASMRFKLPCAMATMLPTAIDKIASTTSMPSQWPCRPCRPSVSRRISIAKAAMKYFILGALSSGLLLYGMSILYGVTGSLDLGEIGAYLAQGGAENKVVLMFAVAFIIVGVAFKRGAVPFHMWIPDVYHGAATPVTLYISTAPKIAAFAMLMRLLTDGLQGLHGHWEGMLVVLAILSMAVGNIVAIAQGNLKRMLAYSTVSHVGFLLLGILTGGNAGYAASMFYVIVYALMSLGGIGMIILLSRAGFEAENLEDF